MKRLILTASLVVATLLFVAEPAGAQCANGMCMLPSTSSVSRGHFAHGSGWYPGRAFVRGRLWFPGKYMLRGLSGCR